MGRRLREPNFSPPFRAIDRLIERQPTVVESLALCAKLAKEAYSFSFYLQHRKNDIIRQLHTEDEMEIKEIARRSGLSTHHIRAALRTPTPSGFHIIRDYTPIERNLEDL